MYEIRRVIIVGESKEDWDAAQEAKDKHIENGFNKTRSWNSETYHMFEIELEKRIGQEEKK